MRVVTSASSPSGEFPRSCATALEERRLDALFRSALLDTPPEQAFDEAVTHASILLDMPMAAFSLVDRDRQWFKASVGMPLPEIDRTSAFCRHVIASDAELIIVDTLQDARFADNPFVIGAPHLRSYAGVPIRAFGQPIGSLAVLACTPRELDERALDTLRFLARHLEHLVDLHGRRAAERPPLDGAVEAFARRLADGEPFDHIGLEIDRPACIYDCETLRIVDVNQRAVETYGWPHEQFVERTILEVLTESDQRVAVAVHANAQLSEYSTARTWRHRRADGEILEVKITSAETTVAGRPTRLVVVTDVTTQASLADALDRAAHLDSLTGLANRRQFIKDVTTGLDIDACSLAVLFIDLDDFKLVNDTLGHDAGDDLLAAAAARLREVTPVADLVARLGGDEFAVSCRFADPDEAVLLAESIRDALRAPFSIGGTQWYTSASIGLAISTSASTAKQLLTEADAAMYAAKEAGRNGYAVFDLQLSERLTASAQLRNDLHRALDHDEIGIALQPIVDTDGEVVCYEALARWQHPVHGELLPGSFIDIAEESGLIVRLGARIMELGAAQVERLGVSVSVNVSARQFNQTLVELVDRLVGRHGDGPGRLIVEITESLVADHDHARVVLDGLQAAGVQVWIDDFGTGYSSLARLNSLPVDGLKLAKEFVHDLDSTTGRGIAAAIVGIAEALDILVIAEGVETERQHDQVRALGCGLAQGYLFGRPAASTTFGRV